VKLKSNSGRVQALLHCSPQLFGRAGIQHKNYIREKMLTVRNSVRLLTVAAALQLFTVNAVAQESAYADLDACTRSEQIKLTAKGALAGALAGFSGAFLTGNREKAGKAALAGALGGGAIGLATAFYTAIETCKKLNPGWITESTLVRDTGRTYAQVKKEHQYVPKQGVVLRMHDMTMSGETRPGSEVAIGTYYDVMTPDGAETPVVLSRKLYVIADGNEKAVPFPMAELATRTVEAGRNKESLNLPIPADAKPGTEYRVELSAAAGDQAATSLSRTVKVI
jgi:hypothetical protein